MLRFSTTLKAFNAFAFRLSAWFIIALISKSRLILAKNTFFFSDSNAFTATVTPLIFRAIVSFLWVTTFFVRALKQAKTSLAWCDSVAAEYAFWTTKTSLHFCHVLAIELCAAFFWTAPCALAHFLFLSWLVLRRRKDLETSCFMYCSSAMFSLCLDC